MRAHRWTATLALAAAAAASPSGTPASAHTAAAEATVPFGVRDLVRLARISQAAVSPDGKRVAYVLRTTDMDANSGGTAIWTIETRKRDASPGRLTDLEANSSSPEWSGDGRFLYYLSNRSGSMQVWRIAPGGDPKQVTALPLDVGSFHVSPKSDRVFVTVEVFTDCATLACSKERLDTAGHRREHGVLYDRIFVRHWDTWSDGRRSQLFSIPLDPSGAADGTPVNLTSGLDGDVPSKPFGGSEDYAISPDGQLVAFSVRAVPVGEPWSTNFDIYIVPAAGGAQRNLTADNPAEDEQPAFSPDGTRLAYLASERPGFESDRLHLVLVDPKTYAKHPLTQSWDRSIGSYQWSRDGKTLFATTDHLGQHPLWAIDAATGRAAAITGDGDVESFSVGPKEIFYTVSTLASPANLYSVGFGGGKPRQLTRINQEELAARRLGEYQQFNFAGANGDNVFGYVDEAREFQARSEVPGCVSDSRRPAGEHGEQLALALECAGVRRSRLRRGDDRLPRFDRLRPGVHRLDQRRLGRQAARGS